MKKYQELKKYYVVKILSEPCCLPNGGWSVDILRREMVGDEQLPDTPASIIKKTRGAAYKIKIGDVYYG